MLSNASSYLLKIKIITPIIIAKIGMEMRLYNPLPMVSEEGNEEDISVSVESLFVIDSTFLTEIKDKKTKETYYL